MIELKIVRTDGGAQLVPADMPLLNPECEGRRRYLYLAWFVDPRQPAENAQIRDTVEGRGYGPHLYGYMTDCVDLYKTGRHDTPVGGGRLEALADDFTALMSLMLDAAGRDLPEGAGWAFMYALCDCTGREVPVGCTDAVYPMGGE